MHPDLYRAIMDGVSFSEEPFMAALNHLVNHKAHGTSFVEMVPPHMVLWLRTYLANCYYNMHRCPWGHGDGDGCMEVMVMT
jgi:hypothetical protein